MGHLSEKNIFLYVDGEISPEQLAKISKHLSECEKCQSILAGTRKLSDMLRLAVKEKVPVDRCIDCLDEVQISGYLDGNLSFDERRIVEEHLSKCGYCLRITLDVKERIRKKNTEDVPSLLYEKTISLVKKTLRENKLSILIKKFDLLIGNLPAYVQSSLEGLVSNVKAKFMETFRYPCPSFSPVFGEGEATEFIVLSPFGKVRYPIIFEWRPYNDAEKYNISIEDISWSCTTKQTKVKLEPEVRLDYGQEYMWVLKAIKGKEIVDEITGFFTLASREEIKEIEEIEAQLNNIKPPEDGLILLGGIFEEKELFIDAINMYKQAYALQHMPGIAYRIAYCYDRLELDELRDEWNKKVQQLDGGLENEA